MQMVDRRAAGVGKRQGLANAVNIGCKPGNEGSHALLDESCRAFRRGLHRRASAVDAWRSRIVNAGIDVAAAGEGAFRADECNAIPLRARQHQIVASEAAEWADHVLERRQLCGHSAKSLGDIRSLQSRCHACPSTRAFGPPQDEAWAKFYS